MDSTARDVVFVKDISTGMGSYYKTSALEISSHLLEQFLFCANIYKVLLAFFFVACVKLQLSPEFTFQVFLHQFHWAQQQRTLRIYRDIFLNLNIWSENCGSFLANRCILSLIEKVLALQCWDSCKQCVSLKRVLGFVSASIDFCTLTLFSHINQFIVTEPP